MPKKTTMTKTPTKAAPPIKMQHSIGRPKLPDAERRVMKVLCSFTEDEYNLLMAQANAQDAKLAPFAAAAAVTVAKRLQRNKSMRGQA